MSDLGCTRAERAHFQRLLQSSMRLALGTVSTAGTNLVRSHLLRSVPQLRRMSRSAKRTKAEAAATDEAPLPTAGRSAVGASALAGDYKPIAQVWQSWVMICGTRVCTSMHACMHHGSGCQRARLTPPTISCTWCLQAGRVSMAVRAAHTTSALRSSQGVRTWLGNWHMHALQMQFCSRAVGCSVFSTWQLASAVCAWSCCRRTTHQVHRKHMCARGCAPCAVHTSHSVHHRHVQCIHEQHMHALQDLLSFINYSWTPFHAVEDASRRLLAAGYTHISEKDRWAVKVSGGFNPR